ncbi:MAG: trehalose-phosphatase [Bacteroidetes bacterium]|nr:trehalose-phosphatase [Bacteroidota bacterium]HET6243731.1 trehalose-phosphatase [Bacteroidia bacterium]
MKNNLQAAIVDLDGVITNTAIQHAKAWKIMFDQYNKQREQEGNKKFLPFSIESDYPKYIDGIPRYDGVREFLKSREIEIPYGDPKDNAGKETICGLGNWKNELFHKVIKDEGIQVIEKNIEAIKNWKKLGLKTAVISSSKNCKQILEATGYEYLFDTRVDGIISVERNIKGKPAPDIFLEAARELNVKPENALIVEDSLAGVEAGKKGDFALVVGIKNGSNTAELLKKGADEVVDNLQQVDINLKKAKLPKYLPLAIKHIPELKEKFKNNKALLFLDFDGTLAPIVEFFEDAAMSEEMKELLERLASKYQVAVISGRGLSDVKNRVGLNNIYYAGSHGFEISGPNGFYQEHELAHKIIPVFDVLIPELNQKLKSIPGLKLERKKFTLAVHYRQVAQEKQQEVIDAVENALKKHREVKAGKGKKVIEIRPNIDWDKGKAVSMLIHKLDHSKNEYLPVYIGDDITDEDVFIILDNGLGILVGEHGSQTYADYYLRDVQDVQNFLNQLLIE